jgi:flagellar biosynthesis anti-sigma factor FlgM
MVGIQGIGNVPEPIGPKSGAGKAKETEKSTVSTDNVSISSEAAQAAEIIQAATAAGVSEIRQERVEEARANIEQGTYKVQDVVRQVAARLTKYLG